MAIAKRCDICKEFYSSYDEGNNADKPNGLIFVSSDVNHKYYSYGITDCCPRCMTSIKAHIDILKRRGE